MDVFADFNIFAADCNRNADFAVKISAYKSCVLPPIKIRTISARVWQNSRRQVLEPYPPEFVEPIRQSL